MRRMRIVFDMVGRRLEICPDDADTLAWIMTEALPVLRRVSEECRYLKMCEDPEPYFQPPPFDTITPKRFAAHLKRVLELAFPNERIAVEA